MELTLKDQKAKLAIKEGPHYFRVTLREQVSGALTRDCGSLRDLASILGMYPDATVEKVFLPVISGPIDVLSVSIEPDKALPESDLQVFKTT